MRKVPIEEQIAEVERELKMRTHVYPGLVASDKLKPLQAIKQNEGMMAVLDTLKWVQKNKDRLKEQARQPA